MATKSDEYNSLRQEIIEHQSRRTSVLSLALTASAALFATAAQLRNPYLPLFALLLLYFARVQIAQTHYSIQRIASYIRVVLEEDNPDLNWETASYAIRLASTQKQKTIWNVSPLAPIDNLLFFTGVVALALAAFLPWLISATTPAATAPAPPSSTPDLWPPPVSLYVAIVSAIIWLGLWLRYNRRIRELESMRADEKEEAFWHRFKSKKGHGI